MNITEADALATYINGLIVDDKLIRFYQRHEWRELRAKILKENHYECAQCKERGKISRAETVHHINHVTERPELALSEYYTDEKTGEKKRNLIPLCHDCHDEAHERFKFKEKPKQLNKERW